jgi:prolyl 4-hydroxylase
LDYYKTKHAELVIQEDLVNPIDAYFLIKRLSFEWEAVEELLTPTVPSNLTRIASEVDLQGAAVALSRVHDTYGLNITEITEGYLLGTRYSQPLSIEDCFEIGQQMKGYGDNYYAMVWLQEALRKCQSQEEEADIIDEFHPILYNATHRELALALVSRLLVIEPANHEAQVYKKMYETSVGASNVTYAEIFQAKFHRRRDPKDGLDPKLRTRYNRLCRGDTDKSPKRLAALRCRFLYDSYVFSRLAPFKLEEVYKNPDIVVYHDVISDAEIMKIQKITKPLVRSRGLRLQPLHSLYIGRWNAPQFPIRLPANRNL